MKDETKSVRLKVRNSDPAVYHQVTPSIWKRMQEKEANRAFYEEVADPKVPQEVAAKVAAHKDLAGSKKPASDDESITTTDRLPADNAGQIG